ncbi:MAG: peptide chain release factor 2 [bacterium]|nr:peptide chain release factor 2 [bacterium]
MLIDLKKTIDSLHQKILQMKEYLDLAGVQQQLSDLEKQTSQPNFWDNPTTAQQVSQKISELRTQLNSWGTLEKELEDLRILTELAIEAQDVPAFAGMTVIPAKNDVIPAEAGIELEIRVGLEKLTREFEHLEFQSILYDEFDKHNCFLYLHPGAGGTESCDWANMLLRMYLRWAEQQGFTTELMEVQSGDEAGIKSATVLINGEYAYGYLKAEVGVHRLVRISPFDANKRRHTSFASVYVYPEVDETIDVEIKDADLRIDTFRSSGAGGQHVNVTDSAVRITHLPTGIVASCQNERSQHKNRAVAMKILRSRLYEHEREKKEQEAEKLEQQKKDIAWGSQIRSYTFQPYCLVKDHRTGLEIGNVQAVMDGEITPFIEEYLKWQLPQK